jgi:23S rRNA (adenine2503-C2)-methyltransferase
MPSISTIAPQGCNGFFERLLEIKQRNYTQGHFQLQFSIHTTDEALRDLIIPVRKWSFSKISEYAERFYAPGDRKITLNFALSSHAQLDAAVLQQHFSPDKFLVKITPLNPTYRAVENKLESRIDGHNPNTIDRITEALHDHGFEVIISIGNLEENQVGSNCGQYLRTHLDARKKMGEGYTYPIVQNQEELLRFPVSG